MSTAPPLPDLQEAARLLAEGRPAAAAERLAALVAGAPTYAAAHVLRATALEAAGRVDEAIVSWGRAAALVPRSPLVHRERARLLATRLADEPADLPPAVPDPEAPPLPADDPEPGPGLNAPPPGAPGASTPGLDADAPASEPPVGLEVSDPDAGPAVGPGPEPDDLEALDGPLIDYGTPRRLDASDLIFPGTPAPQAPAPGPAEPPSEDLPPADAPPAEPDPPSSEPAGPAAADWDPDETGIARVLPPEGLEEPTPPPPPAEASDAGWDLLAEDDVPTPPPGTVAEPDVVAPEGPVTGAPEPPAPEPFDPFSIDPTEEGASTPPAPGASRPPGQEPGPPSPDETTAPVPPPFESLRVGVPPPAPAPPSGPSVADELDDLISQLEHAPRITPDPDFDGPQVSLETGEVDEMASETLAKIYAAQHQYVEAALVYEKLAARQPDRADDHLQRAAELRRRSE